MANIALTATCNRACSFCFATDAMESQPEPGKFMSVEQFDQALDFLVRSQIPEARLLGGEPTLHPEFESFVDRALARGLRLVVFSGGMIPEKALRRLERVPADTLTLLLNVIDPGGKEPQQLTRQEQVLRRLGTRIVLGVTLDSPAVQLGFLLEMIEQYGLARSVRLGLAHPALTGGNSYLHPRHYPEVGRRVTEFGLEAQRRGVRLEFDCGWVPCMFPEGALVALGKTPDDVGLRCSPILDLLPDGQMISCYPLATHATAALASDHDARQLRAHFVLRQQNDRQLMLYRECEQCSWRARGECTGGCLSASLRRLRRREFSVSVPRVSIGVREVTPAAPEVA
jgi:radical SAM protein with 4Fe4S-binding SPASM domain